MNRSRSFDANDSRDPLVDMDLGHRERLPTPLRLPETESPMSQRVQKIHADYETIRQLHERTLADVGPIRAETVGTMASFPGRDSVIPFTLASIIPQLDRLFLFLNNYKEVPSYIKDVDPDGKVVPILSGDIDLSALGKTFALDLFHDCTVFSLDDDLFYPHNYVERMRGLLDSVDGTAVIAAHGSILKWPLQHYYERERKFSFDKPLWEVRFCTLAGSGHLAFRSGVLRPSFWDFFPLIMVDLQYGILARQRGLPILAIPRGRHWLAEIAEVSGLFEQMKYTYQGRTYHYYKAVENGPWDFASFKELYRAWFGAEYGRVEQQGDYYLLPNYGIVDGSVQTMLWDDESLPGWSARNRSGKGSLKVRASQAIARSLARNPAWVRRPIRSTFALVGGERFADNIRSRILDVSRFKKSVIGGDLQVQVQRAPMYGWYQKAIAGKSDAPPAVFIVLNSQYSTSQEVKVDAGTSACIAFTDIEGFRGIVVEIQLVSPDDEVLTPMSSDTYSYLGKEVALAPPQKRRKKPRVHSIFVSHSKPFDRIIITTLSTTPEADDGENGDESDEEEDGFDVDTTGEGRAHGCNKS